LSHLKAQGKQFLAKHRHKENSSMKVMVVYDSAYGNTEKVARAIGQALGPAEEVEVVQVGNVSPEQLAGLTALVVGSPTQKFSPLGTISRFLKSIPQNGLQGVKVAAFDTRITESEVERVRILAFFVRIFGYAAKPIADRLEKKGGELTVPPEGFYVGGTEGPLLEGELERAADWARQIATAV
jgi:flavodoxin I